MNRQHYHIGLWTFSKDFFDAACALRQNEEELSPTPVYYLYAHSIELSLKAFLVTKGYAESGLRKIGHNLQKAWSIAKDNNVSTYLSDIQEIEETIDLVGPYYDSKEFEYIYTGFKRYPKIIHMHNSAALLVEGIGRHIREIATAT